MIKLETRNLAATIPQNQSWSAGDFTQAELGFAKTVSNLVQQKYDLVTKDLQEHEQKRKVLAGILIRSSDKVQTLCWLLQF